MDDPITQANLTLASQTMDGPTLRGSLEKLVDYTDELREAAAEEAFRGGDQPGARLAAVLAATRASG